jgi:DNA repair exonuclease SbcCD ATPase subunit
MNELEKLLEKEKQLKAKIQAAKSRESEKQRKLDTRRKILIGAMIIEGMKNSAEYETKIRQNLDKYLTKNKDRVLFGLPEIKEG